LLFLVGLGGGGVGGGGRGGGRPAPPAPPPPPPATLERAIATLEPLAAEPVLRRAHALAAKLAPAAVLPDGSLERPDGSIEGSDGGLEP